MTMPIEGLNPVSAISTVVQPTPKDLAGIYVGAIDIPGPYYKAELKVAEDGSYKVRVAESIDSGPSPEFAGTWRFADGHLHAKHTIPGFGEVTIDVDLSGVGGDLKGKELKAQVNIAGQEVPFKFAKTDKPFFTVQSLNSGTPNFDDVVT
jgi:hypothetical protein